MQAGQILLTWDTERHLSIKTTLSMNSSEAKQLALDMLLQAGLTINNSGTPLILANGPTRVLGGA